MRITRQNVFKKLINKNKLMKIPNIDNTVFTSRGCHAKGYTNRYIDNRRIVSVKIDRFSRERYTRNNRIESRRNKNDNTTRTET